MIKRAVIFLSIFFLLLSIAYGISNKSFIETLHTLTFDDSTDRASFRFTAPYDIAFDKIHIPFGNVTGNPYLILKIEGDNGAGRPNGSSINGTATTLSPSVLAWISVDVGNGVFLSGQTYHILFDVNFLGGGSFEIYFTNPEHRVFPLNQYYDSSASIMVFDGAWSDYSGMPVFAVESSSGPHFGNPYAGPDFEQCYSADRIYGQALQSPPVSTQFSGIGAYVKMNGSPTTPLYYAIYEYPPGPIVYSGVFANPGDLSTSSYTFRIIQFTLRHNSKEINYRHIIY